MKILVIGSGGREHAICLKLKQSSRVKELFCAPGNGGISDIAECVDIKATDVDGVVKFASEKKIDLTVVAPDNPLMLGMVDALEEAGLRSFGPSKAAALIEGSKVFSKNLMKKYSIPTAFYEVFDDAEVALKYLKKAKFPIVVKADGLALGKGVIIAKDFAEAEEAVILMMKDMKFGKAGKQIVLEEFLKGPEVSILAFTDGKTVVPMVSSQDYKKLYDEEGAPNTGGMGSFSPSPHYTPSIEKESMEKIFLPTINAMNCEGRKFKGVLYFGLMFTTDGPKILEYNARFGDPETQVVLSRMKTDLVNVMEAVIEERLETIEITWEKYAATCVILASGGYPNDYVKGYQIEGLETLKGQQNVQVFHAGTKKVNGKYFTDGGRVFGVTGFAESVPAAAALVYSSIRNVKFKDIYYRKDIGKFVNS
jgi:phosphoribosylamine--glycine ligase